MLAALMTLRHRITQTGANSLEPYFQPRMLAFALGAWAIAAYLRGAAARRSAICRSHSPCIRRRRSGLAIWAGARSSCRSARWRVPLAVLAALGALPRCGPSCMDRCAVICTHGPALGFGDGWQGLHLSVRLERLLLAGEPELSGRRHRDLPASEAPRSCAAARERAGGRRSRPCGALSGVLASHDRRRCTCVAASDLARVLDPGFSRGIYLAWLFAEAPARPTCGAPLWRSPSRRRRPRSFRVALGACRQPDRADRISAG